MAVFGKKSLELLAPVHPALIQICMAAIEVYDFAVTEGERSREKQQAVFNQKLSKVQWPKAMHCTVTPEEAQVLGIAPRPKSVAVDLAPVPIDWTEKTGIPRFFYLAGVMMTTARRLGIAIRWGHDWNKNNDFFDQKFQDAPHFELVLNADGTLFVPK